MAQRIQLATSRRLAVEPRLRQQQVEDDQRRRTRARAGRPRGATGASRPRRALRRARRASSTSFHAATTSSAVPRPPRPRAAPSRGCGATRPTDEDDAAPAVRGARSRGSPRASSRGCEPHRAGEQRAQVGRPEEVVLLRPRLPERGRTRGAPARSGSQWTSGSRVCTSIGNQRFGVVRKTRRPTRSASRTNASWRSRAADVLDDGVRVDDVERRRRRTAARTRRPARTRSPGTAPGSAPPSWSPSAVIRAGHG